MQFIIVTAAVADTCNNCTKWTAFNQVNELSVILSKQQCKTLAWQLSVSTPYSGTELRKKLKLLWLFSTAGTSVPFFSKKKWSKVRSAVYNVSALGRSFYWCALILKYLPNLFLTHCRWAGNSRTYRHNCSKAPGTEACIQDPQVIQLEEGWRCTPVCRQTPAASQRRFFALCFIRKADPLTQ